MPTYHYKPHRSNCYWVLTHPSISIGSSLRMYCHIVYVTRQHSSIGSHVCTRPTLLGPTLDPIRISSRVCMCVWSHYITDKYTDQRRPPCQAVNHSSSGERQGSVGHFPPLKFSLQRSAPPRSSMT